ncbi:MAG: sigma-70 family RNA polymerase sigma factor [Planctomycetota bacterium]|nr:sigma-70 family RNA polymerase sigma factor [Planctomycetota bacterium]
MSRGSDSSKKKAVTLSEDPDARLMLRVRDSDDQQAFQTLLERNHQNVMNLAWRYFHDRQKAEDIAQETFLRVYNARKSYKPEAKFKTWLLRIATNLCISGLRKKRIQAHRLTMGEDNKDHEITDDKASDPAFAPEQREIKDRVRAAVDTLPERQRVAIILSRFHGLTYPELEKALGLSRMALKSLLHRARETLKQRLLDYMDEEERA